MSTTPAPVIDDSPARVSSALALATGLACTLSLVGSVASLTIGLLGLVTLGLGLVRGSRAVVTLGGTGLFCGVVLSGLAGAPAGIVVFATAAAVVAWDIATFGIGVGEELGRAASTGRLELVHAAASGAVAAIPAVAGVVLFRTVVGGSSLVPVALLCGAVVLVVVLRP